jgi:hypothetical protein
MVILHTDEHQDKQQDLIHPDPSFWLMVAIVLLDSREGDTMASTLISTLWGIKGD